MDAIYSLNDWGNRDVMGNDVVNPLTDAELVTELNTMLDETSAPFRFALKGE
jgi:hypothetical protein